MALSPSRRVLRSGPPDSSRAFARWLLDDDRPASPSATLETTGLLPSPIATRPSWESMLAPNDSSPASRTSERGDHRERRSRALPPQHTRRSPPSGRHTLESRHDDQPPHHPSESSAHSPSPGRQIAAELANVGVLQRCTACAVHSHNLSPEAVQKAADVADRVLLAAVAESGKDLSSRLIAEREAVVAASPSPRAVPVAAGSEGPPLSPPAGRMLNFDSAAGGSSRTTATKGRGSGKQGSPPHAPSHATRGYKGMDRPKSIGTTSRTGGGAYAELRLPPPAREGTLGSGGKNEGIERSSVALSSAANRTGLLSPPRRSPSQSGGTQSAAAAPQIGTSVLPVRLGSPLVSHGRSPISVRSAGFPPSTTAAAPHADVLSQAHHSSLVAALMERLAEANEAREEAEAQRDKARTAEALIKQSAWQLRERTAMLVDQLDAEDRKLHEWERQIAGLQRRLADETHGRQTAEANLAKLVARQVVAPSRKRRPSAPPSHGSEIPPSTTATPSIVSNASPGKPSKPSRRHREASPAEKVRIDRPNSGPIPLSSSTPSALQVAELHHLSVPPPLTHGGVAAEEMTLRPPAALVEDDGLTTTQEGTGAVRPASTTTTLSRAPASITGGATDGVSQALLRRLQHDAFAAQRRQLEAEEAAHRFAVAADAGVRLLSPSICSFSGRHRAKEEGERIAIPPLEAALLLLQEAVRRTPAGSSPRRRFLLRSESAERTPQQEELRAAPSTAASPFDAGREAGAPVRRDPLLLPPNVPTPQRRALGAQQFLQSLQHQQGAE